jgi:hypothetical protein
MKLNIEQSEIRICGGKLQISKENNHQNINYLKNEV